MTQLIFVIYDCKSESYGKPIFTLARGQLLRELIDIVSVPAPPEGVKDERHTFARHSGDYSLFYIGIYDEIHCKFELASAPEHVCVLLELKSNK